MSSEREKFDEWFRKTRYMMPKYEAMLDAWNARAALAAAPAQAQQATPLTREKIEELFEDGLEFESKYAIVREIERAHNIGNE